MLKIVWESNWSIALAFHKEHLECNSTSLTPEEETSSFLKMRFCVVQGRYSLLCSSLPWQVDPAFPEMGLFLHAPSRPGPEGLVCPLRNVAGTHQALITAEEHTSGILKEPSPGNLHGSRLTSQSLPVFVPSRYLTYTVFPHFKTVLLAFILKFCESANNYFFS